MGLPQLAQVWGGGFARPVLPSSVYIIHSALIWLDPVPVLFDFVLFRAMGYVFQCLGHAPDSSDVVLG